MHGHSLKDKFYKQMIDHLGNALNLLDKQGQDEVFRFLISQLNPDGGFQDRGGRSDLYYSLFGGLMLMAWGKEQGAWGMERGLLKKREDERLETETERGDTEPATGNRQLATGNRQPATGSLLKLRQFISGQSNRNVPGFIERCCLVLLQKELKSGKFSRIKALFSLGHSFWKERHSINLSYRSFVFFLTLDAALPIRGFLKMASKRMLARTTIDINSPCSEVAAKVFLLKMMNRDGVAEQELLKSLACESGGFKAFLHLQNADMLSTAVALFALNFAGSDLRLLKPLCFGFIQSNFAEGAFLSGDGDPTADVEYTFYGLLALGVLAG